MDTAPQQRESSTATVKGHTVFFIFFIPSSNQFLFIYRGPPVIFKENPSINDDENKQTILEAIVLYCVRKFQPVGLGTRAGSDALLCSFFRVLF